MPHLNNECFHFSFAERVPKSRNCICWCVRRKGGNQMNVYTTSSTIRWVQRNQLEFCYELLLFGRWYLSASVRRWTLTRWHSSLTQRLDQMRAFMNQNNKSQVTVVGCVCLRTSLCIIDKFSEVYGRIGRTIQAINTFDSRNSHNVGCVDNVLICFLDALQAHNSGRA